MNNVSSQREYFSQRMWRKRRARLMDMFCEVLAIIVGGSGLAWIAYRFWDIVEHSPIGLDPILGTMVIGFASLAIFTYVMLKFNPEEKGIAVSETKTVYF